MDSDLRSHGVVPTPSGQGNSQSQISSVEIYVYNFEILSAFFPTIHSKFLASLNVPASKLAA